MAWPFLWCVPPIIAVLRRFRPGTGAGAYIPTSLLRYVAFKLHVDIQKVRWPAPGAWSSAGLCATSAALGDFQLGVPKPALPSSCSMDCCPDLSVGHQGVRAGRAPPQGAPHGHASFLPNVPVTRLLAHSAL